MNFLRKHRHIFFLFLVICLILFIYHFPDLLAYLKTPKGMVFLGQNQFFDPWDINLYVSAIRYGQSGHFLLPNLYTSLPNTPIFIYSFLTSIGIIFKTTNPFLLFTLFSIFSGALIVLVFYILIRALHFSAPITFLALLAICLGGGMGGLSLVFNNIIPSADITNSSFTFYSTFVKFHEAIGMLCYIAALVLGYFFFTSQEKKKNSLILWSFLTLSIAFIVYPYLIASFFLIIITFLFFLKRLRIRKKDYTYVILAIPTIAIVLFIFAQFSQNQTFGDVFSQHLSVDFFSLSLGYGITLLLFIYQLLWVRQKTPLIIFLNTWIICSLVLAFLPLGPGKLYLRGLFFPFVLLGIMTLEQIAKRLEGKKLIPHIRIWLLGIFLILTVSTSAYIFKARIDNISPNNPWGFMPYEEFKGFQFLNTQTPTESSVLALYTLGNQIPAFTHNTVYFGHLIQTPDAQNSLNNAGLFYSGETSVEQSKSWLKTNKIAYIAIGPAEYNFYRRYAKKGNSLTPLLAQFKLAFYNTDMVIYKTSY